MNWKNIKDFLGKNLLALLTLAVAVYIGIAQINLQKQLYSIDKFNEENRENRENQIEKTDLARLTRSIIDLIDERDQRLKMNNKESVEEKLQLIAILKEKVDLGLKNKYLYKDSLLYSDCQDIIKTLNIYEGFLKNKTKSKQDAELPIHMKIIVENVFGGARNTMKTIESKFDLNFECRVLDKI
ncbi:MAG: hypothetical protein JZU53_13415 [Paludibacter sp.]|nr:hypothetical protein [Paludibacter sp.]